MKTILKFSLFFLFLPCMMQAQTIFEKSQLDRKSQKKYDKALQLIREKETDKAVEILINVTDKFPCFYEGRYKLAWQYLRLEKKEKALTEFKQILPMKELPDYKLVVALTNLYEEKEDYSEAVATMNYFIEHINAEHNLWDYATRRKEELSFRMHAYLNPKRIQPTALGPEVNTKYSEYLPAFNASGTEMIFTRRLPMGRGMQEDLYISRLDKNGVMAVSVPIDELNTSQNEGAHCFSQDGNILVFTSCDRERRNTGCDLYISFRKKGEWSEPVNMGPGINTRYWESQPALSADNKTLYFSSSRSGGYGNKDIWYVQLEESGWSEPVNMGKNINSPGNEGSPFLHPDDKTFYFRSDGHIGLGDYDLFVSRKEDKEWSKPINMSYPINSKASEGALFVELTGKKAYYTSDQFNEDNNLDILYFDLPEEFRPEKISYLMIRVTDNESGRPLQAQVQLTSLKDSMSSRIIESNEEGQVLMPIPRGEYIIHIDKSDYLFYSSQLELINEADFDKPFVFNVKLKGIPKAAGTSTKPVILNNIFFESGSSVLLEKSNPEIKALYRLIRDDDRTLFIVGYTDNVGKDEDNLLLSTMRAKAVYDALVEMGISKARLHYEGKGEKNPIADNNTEEGRAANRRTEFYLHNNE